MFRKFLPVFLLVALGGGMSVHAADAAPGTESAAAPEPERPLDARDIYQLLLGEIALQRGQLNIAALAWQELARRTGDARALQRAIEVNAAAQQYDAALELLARWTQIGGDETVAEARQFKITLLLAARRFNEMEAPILEMLAANPDGLPYNFFSLTRLFPQFTDKDALYALIVRLAAHYPDIAEAHYTLAMAAIASEREAIARAELIRAESLRPDWEAPLLSLGDLVLRAKTADAESSAAVIARLRSFLARRPDAREVRLQLARALIATRQYPLALQEFDRLLAASPNDSSILYSIAIISLQEKDYDAARKHFARLLELPFPDPGAVRFFLARTEEEAGSPDKALEYYLQVSGGTQYLFARQHAARIVAARGDLPAARALLRASSVQGAAEKTTLTLIEAQLLREAGRHEENSEFLRAALKLQPEDR
ncbi:MAG: tetratricopeptide repeat protein, partial [Zoogloeaceae bacterium]|nr:tetratricopeptide repeat protein [Zoogloeaceae bacterium]